jgi:hypothetical protein
MIQEFLQDHASMLDFHDYHYLIVGVVINDLGIVQQPYLFD